MPSPKAMCGLASRSNTELVGPLELSGTAVRHVEVDATLSPAFRDTFHVADDHHRPELDEQPSFRRADAAGTTRDQGDLPLQCAASQSLPYTAW